jgi:hypothetical protein
MGKKYAFVKYTKKGQLIPGSLVITEGYPKETANGVWEEVPMNLFCCEPITRLPRPLKMTFTSIEDVSSIIGDVTNVEDWNIFFDLPTLGSPFTSVQIEENEVKLYGGSNIKVKPALMYDQGYQYLISINDEAGCITSVGGDAFSYCELLTSVSLPKCKIVYGSDDSPQNDYGGFGYCENLVNLNIPLLEIAGKYAFGECYLLTSINFPKLISCEKSSFSYLYDLTSINLPLCTNLGGTFGYDEVFQDITGHTITATFNPSVLSDSDVVELSLNNNVTINGGQYQPFTGYTGDLTIEFNDITNADLLVGDSSNVTDWNTFFDLPDWSTPFTSVTISGDIVTLEGGENIAIKYGKFDTNGNIISITDQGCVSYLSNDCFYNCNSLTTIDLPSLTTAGDNCCTLCISLTTLDLPSLTTAGDNFFFDCQSLTPLDLPSLTTAGNNCFGYCQSLTTISLPNLTNIGYACFYYCQSLTSINLPLCTNLGPTVGDDSVFQDISSNTITLTVPSALMTCDSGNPDGDIQELQANNTVTIVTV